MEQDAKPGLARDLAALVVGTSKLTSQLSSTKALADAQIGATEWAALELLSGETKLTQASLAKRLGLDPVAGKRLIDPLVSAGLISKSRMEIESKKVVLALTDRGRELLVRIGEALAPLLTAAVDRRPAVLTKLNRNLRVVTRSLMPEA